MKESLKKIDALLVSLKGRANVPTSEMTDELLDIRNAVVSDTRGGVND